MIKEFVKKVNTTKIIHFKYKFIIILSEFQLKAFSIRYKFSRGFLMERNLSDINKNSV